MFRNLQEYFLGSTFFNVTTASSQNTLDTHGEALHGDQKYIKTRDN